MLAQLWWVCLFGLDLLVLIAAAELVADHFKLPAWPAFMAMIFFFAEHMDARKASLVYILGIVFAIVASTRGWPLLATGRLKLDLSKTIAPSDL